MIVLKINNNRNCDATKKDGYQMKWEDKDVYPEACDVGMGCMMGENIPGALCPPVWECPQETVCHRYICHEVPHIIPCNTRIINHHIYRHTYMPAYSCCEENDVQNVYERRCC